MSHISILDNQNQRTLALSNPWHQHKKRYKECDFQRTKDAMATPKRFVTAETPRPRRLKFMADLIAGIEEEGPAKEILKEISGKTWRCFGVSPLFNFGPLDDFSSLENYLEANLDLQLPDSVVRSVKHTDKDSHWKVKVETIKGMRGHCDDHECLKIQVSLPKKDDHDQVMMTAFLLSIGSSEISGFDQQTDDNMRVLPCCICRGDAAVTNFIFAGLERRFDCKINPVLFDDETLRWMSAMWMGTEKIIGKELEVNNEEQDQGNVDLRYEIPLECGINHVDVSLKSKMMVEFWKSFFGEDDNSEISEEDVEDFHALLNEQFKRSFKVHMDRMLLIGIKTSSFRVKKSGVFGIESEDLVKTVLSYFTEICQGSIRNVFPEMAAEEDKVIRIGSNS